MEKGKIEFENESEKFIDEDFPGGIMPFNFRHKSLGEIPVHINLSASRDVASVECSNCSALQSQLEKCETENERLREAASHYRHCVECGEGLPCFESKGYAEFLDSESTPVSGEK